MTLQSNHFFGPMAITMITGTWSISHWIFSCTFSQFSLHWSSMQDQYSVHHAWKSYQKSSIDNDYWLINIQQAGWIMHESRDRIAIIKFIGKLKYTLVKDTFTWISTNYYTGKTENQDYPALHFGSGPPKFPLT